MARVYTSYLLRRWQQHDGREWVELLHVATGERRRFPSLADACAWLQAPGGTAIAPHPASPTPGAQGRDPPPSEYG